MVEGGSISDDGKPEHHSLLIKPCQKPLLQSHGWTVELKARIRPVVVHGDARTNSRRQLNLRVSAREPASSSILVVVRNLSISGLLIETDEKLAIGDVIEFELPVAGCRLASVVWMGSNQFGCKFSEPISQGSVSAALLQSPIEGRAWPDLGSEPAEDFELGSDADNTSNDLPISAKFWIIVSLTIVSWGVVGALVMLAVYLLDLLGRK